MPDSSTKLREDVVRFQSVFYEASTYVAPHFEMGIQLYELFRGKRPWQLESTATKMMVNLAYSMVLDRLPKLKKNIFSGEDFVSLEAKTPEDEPGVDPAQAWLRSVLKDADQINILATIDPTILSALITGTGYRMPFARKNSKGKWFVSSRDVDFFQIIPAPVGGDINPPDPTDDDALPYFFHLDWMTDTQIKALSAFPGYQKDEAEKLFKMGEETEGGLNTVYQERFRVLGGVNYGDTKNSWRTQYNSDAGPEVKGKRRRVANWYSRVDNSWKIIAQDNFCIYDGPLPMGDRILPLVKYSITNDLNNFFGIGALEMVQDIIVAYLLTKNYRLDHLSRVIFPAKWIREELFAGHTDSDFYDKPFSVYHIPSALRNVGIHDLFYYDRAPEISPQIFIEDKDFREILEMTGGSPNMADKMSGSNTASSTATGALSFVNQVSGRIDSESMLLEFGGLSQEARLLLMLGEKYFNEDQFVRDSKAPNGTGWRSIDSAYVGDRYVVKTNGTKSSSDEQAKFNKILAMWPLLNGNPLVDQHEMISKMVESSGVSNFKEILNAPGTQGPQGGAGGEAGAEPGGMASIANARNAPRSVAGATTKKPVGQPL